MKITLAELTVLLDTAIGSLSIADRRDFAIFKYSAEQRRQAANSILGQMGQAEVEVDDGSEVTREQG